MTIHVPAHRKEKPDICIEFLYKDNELTKWVDIDGVQRRAFLGNEFDECGFYLGTDEFSCTDKNACGATKMQIIDGSGDNKVVKPFSGDRHCNYALSKMMFANMVLEKKEPFDNVSFDGFIPLFEVLNSILNVDGICEQPKNELPTEIDNWNKVSIICYNNRYSKRFFYATIYEVASSRLVEGGTNDDKKDIYW